MYNKIHTRAHVRVQSFDTRMWIHLQAPKRALLFASEHSLDFLQRMNWSIAGLSVGIWAGYCGWIIRTDSHTEPQTSQQVS